MSDHFSGPRAIAGPAGDITDLYAFPSPERPGHLTLVMNVMPRATASSRFSDAIVCRFRLRPVTIAGLGPSTAFPFGPEEYEIVYSCSFETPEKNGGGPSVQRGRCVSSTGAVTDFRVDDPRPGRCEDLRVFAGLRSDPFFFDLPAFNETIQTGRLAFQEAGTNSGAGANVLSIVVEVDCAPLLQAGHGSLFAVVAETVVAGSLPIRLERVGRPEIKNVVLSAKQFDTTNRDLEVRDLYNLEDAFHLSREYRGVYRGRLNANLAAVDRLDGSTDWPVGADGTHPLTDLLLADYLIVDLAKPFTEESFLEIERATLQGRTYQTCGGRSLNERAIDALYTLLVNADHGPRISDNVSQATKPAASTFPYLAPPNPSFGKQEPTAAHFASLHRGAEHTAVHGPAASGGAPAPVSTSSAGGRP